MTGFDRRVSRLGHRTDLPPVEPKAETEARAHHGAERGFHPVPPVHRRVERDPDAGLENLRIPGVEGLEALADGESDSAQHGPEREVAREPVAANPSGPDPGAEQSEKLAAPDFRARLEFGTGVGLPMPGGGEINPRQDLVGGIMRANSAPKLPIP